MCAPKIHVEQTKKCSNGLPGTIYQQSNLHQLYVMCAERVLRAHPLSAQRIEISIVKANVDCKCETVSKMNITTVFIATDTKLRLIWYRILQILSKNSVKTAKITSFYDIILAKFVPKSCFFTVKWQLFSLGCSCIQVADNGLLFLWIDREINKFNAIYPLLTPFWHFDAFVTSVLAYFSRKISIFCQRKVFQRKITAKNVEILPKTT